MIQKLQKMAAHPVYVGIVSLMAALDLFVMVIPTDALLITAVLANRKRAWITAVCVTFASALAAWALASLIQWGFGPWVNSMFASWANAPLWHRSEEYVRTYGLWATGIICLSPLPLPAAVAVNALSQVPSAAVFVAVLIGRALRYFFLTWIVIYAPHLFEKPKKPSDINH